MWIFLVLMVVVIVLPDLYIWNALVKGLVGMVWLKIVFWFPMVASIAGVVAWACGHHSEWLLKMVFVVLLVFAIPMLVFTIISLIGQGFSLFTSRGLFWCNIIAGLVAVAASISFIYGLTLGWKRFLVKEVTVQSAELPASFKGYRILQISDLHLGTYGHGENSAFLNNVVAKANELNPDMIVFTGDIVNSAADEMDPYMDILRGLKARDGIYSVLGNHDYCEYASYSHPSGAEENRDKVMASERALGWNLLMNEHRVIRSAEGDSIAIIGVENIGKGPFHKRGNLNAAMSGLGDGMFKVLLSHDPSHWRAEVLPKSDIQLTLSGHTHAMQFSIGGFSPASMMYPEWSGLYREGGRSLHVSIGVGGTVPFRLGAWPEINLITLE